MSFGQDRVKDTFYPFGRADSLELIAAHAAHMNRPGEIDQVFRHVHAECRQALAVVRLRHVAGLRR